MVQLACSVNKGRYHLIRIDDKNSRVRREEESEEVGEEETYREEEEERVEYKEELQEIL